VKDHPLLFTDEMVRAILAGVKTETRRVPAGRYEHWKPGDRIWVREAWNVWALTQGGLYLEDHPYPSIPDSYCSSRFCLDYRARKVSDGPWRPSIHMPKWAARLWLEIVEVRREPLQAIGVSAIKAEGVVLLDSPPRTLYLKRFAAIWNAINASRGYPWGANPDVAVIRFRRAGDDGEGGG